MPADRAEPAERREVPANPFGADASSDNTSKGGSDSQKNNEPAVPPEISSLREKARAEEVGQGKPLDDKDKAKLKAYDSWPKPEDAKYRDLTEQDILSRKGLAKPLSPEDQAKLSSKIKFPEEKDEKYRALLERETLSKMNPPQAKELSKFDQAQLYAKLAFPNDSQGQLLQEIDLKFQYGLSKEGLTPGQEAKLGSIKAFPHKDEEKYRSLWERQLRQDKGLDSDKPPLTREERLDLNDGLSGRHRQVIEEQKAAAKKAAAERREPKTLQFN